MNMINARYMGSVWVVAAAAALLGAACASGEDGDGRPLAGDQANDERTGEAEQRIDRYRCYYLQDGFACGQYAGDADVLYECRGRAVLSTRQCLSGCRTMPVGRDDKCGEDP
jgi:hypothetical protein